MRNLFITGGAGFIGSAFVRLLLSARPDVAVTTFDLLTYAGNLDNLTGLDPRRHRFIRGDIADRDAVLAALVPGTDAIVNFAAESHVDRSIASADAFLHTNILGTQSLLDAARARGVGRFVQISTDEVMGSLPEDETAYFTEDSPIAPNNPYAASKAAAEHLVRAAQHTFGLNAVITRCGNNYGPRQFPEKLIPRILTNAFCDQAIPVYGDGGNVRDWIHVDDHCQAILCVLESAPAGAVYNIGARNPRRNIDVVEAILHHLGKPRALIRHIQDRLGHDRRYAIDPTKIELQLGWRPRETWQSGLCKTIQWYQDDRAWFEHAHGGFHDDRAHSCGVNNAA